MILVRYIPTTPRAPALVAAPGDLLVVIAHASSAMLTDLRAAARSADGADIDLARRLGLPASAHPARSGPLQILYGGQVVARDLPLPEAGNVVCLSLRPRGMGRLAAHGFTMLTPVEAPPLSGLVVSAAPRLTPCEAAAALLYPPDVAKPGELQPSALLYPPDAAKPGELQPSALLDPPDIARPPELQPSAAALLATLWRRGGVAP